MNPSEQTRIDGLLLKDPIRTNHFGTNVSEIQKQQTVWAERNFGPIGGERFNKITQLLGVIEEVGELAEAYLHDLGMTFFGVNILLDAIANGSAAHRMLKHIQGIRESAGAEPFANGDRPLSKQEIAELKRDAMGDIFMFLTGLATTEELSLDRDVIARTWAEVRERDFVKFPKNGRSE